MLLHAHFEGAVRILHDAGGVRVRGIQVREHRRILRHRTDQFDAITAADLDALQDLGNPLQTVGFMHDVHPGVEIARPSPALTFPPGKALARPTAGLTNAHEIISRRFDQCFGGHARQGRAGFIPRLGGEENIFAVVKLAEEREKRIGVVLQGVIHGDEFGVAIVQASPRKQIGDDVEKHAGTTGKRLQKHLAHRHELQQPPGEIRLPAVGFHRRRHLLECITDQFKIVKFGIHNNLQNK